MHFRSPLSRTLACVALPALLPAVCAANSVLEHNAPLLGGNLELTLRGAIPGAKVTLFSSPDFGLTTTPWGDFELDRGLASVVATGTVNALGEWTYSAPIPSNPALAETPQHFQALVRPLTAPRELSSAVHLRWLGSRAYATCGGGEFPLGTGQFRESELSIVSLATHQLVATVDLGAQTLVQRRNEALLTSNYARGAVVVGSRIVIFDPFFGGVVGTQSFHSVDPLLNLGTDDSTLYALVVPAPGAPLRLQSIDVSTGQLLNGLDLPAGLASKWAVNAAHSIAYIGSEDDPNTNQCFVQRVDLTTLQDLGATLIGGVGESVLSAIHAVGDKVVIATQAPCWPPSSLASTTRLTETGGAPALVVSSGVAITDRFEALPAFGAFAARSSACSFPGSELRLERVNMPTPPLSLWLPGAFSAVDFAPSSTGLWMVGESILGLSAGWNASHYEIATGTWTWFPFPPWPNYAPAAICEVDDGQGQRACVLYDGADGSPFGVLPPQIYVHSSAGALQTTIPVGFGPGALVVVAVP